MKQHAVPAACHPVAVAVPEMHEAVVEAAAEFPEAGVEEGMLGMPRSAHADRAAVPATCNSAIGFRARARFTFS